MSAHRLLQDLYLDGAPHFIPDPGDAGTFTIDRQFAVCELVSAGAETRTLSDPKFSGQVVTLVHKTDGGAITITASSAVNANGDTSLVFADVGDFLQLVGVLDGSGTYAWRVLGYDGVQIGTAIAALTDSTTETANDTIVDVSTAVAGVDGTASNAASKADVDTRLGAINTNFCDLATKVNAIIARLGIK